MPITIAERLHPFSHKPGTCCLIPGSSIEVQVFPAYLIFKDLEIPLSIKGPVKDFTVQQDLEKGRITVWGDSADGFFRYHIYAGVDNSYYFESEKNIPILPTTSKEKAFKPVAEKLSLGCSKAQDWDLVMRRGEMNEIFPFWHRLGKAIPKTQVKYDGTGKLLLKCKEAVENKDREHLVEQFENLFHAAFRGILVPQLTDDLHQGFIADDEQIDENLSPLFLLSEGANLIQSLFVQFSEKTIEILPVLPPQFHCGRMLNIPTPWGTLDFEWTKKEIRRVIFKAVAKDEITFKYPAQMKHARFHVSNNQRGNIVSLNTPIEIVPDQHYFFDNFQK